MELQLQMLQVRAVQQGCSLVTHTQRLGLWYKAAGTAPSCSNQNFSSAIKTLVQKSTENLEAPEEGKKPSEMPSTIQLSMERAMATHCCVCLTITVVVDAANVL